MYAHIRHTRAYKPTAEMRRKMRTVTHDNMHATTTTRYTCRSMRRTRIWYGRTTAAVAEAPEGRGKFKKKIYDSLSCLMHNPNDWVPFSLGLSPNAADPSSDIAAMFYRHNKNNSFTPRGGGDVARKKWFCRGATKRRVIRKPLGKDYTTLRPRRQLLLLRLLKQLLLLLLLDSFTHGG